MVVFTTPYTLLASKATARKLSIYIQSHGHHAGRPLRSPISNCFTLVCDNKKDLEHMWWTCEMLYRNNAYFQIMRGSVIPFIKKDECNKVIADGLAKTHQHNKNFMKAIKSLTAIDQLIANSVNTKRSALQLQSIILRRFL